VTVSVTQRRIWESRCPSLLADRDRLRVTLEELLDVAERIRGGDTSLDPERWYAARDAARWAVRKSDELDQAAAQEQVRT
jgi:hypothetical protein